MRVRHEDRGSPRRGELPDGAACAGDREVGCRECSAELGSRGDEHVVVAVHALADDLVVPLPGDVQNGGAGAAVRVDGEFVQAARTCERSEERDHRSIGRQPEAGTAFLLRDTSMARRHRAPRDEVLGAVPARDPVCEEHTSGEGRGQAVRQPQVGVGLRQRGRKLLPPCGEDHRPRDVAPATEDDVRPPPLEDRGARPGSAAGPDQRAEQCHRRPAREAGDLEAVEVVARSRDEPSLDPIRRPGERHADAAVAQRRRDCERRQDVPGRSAGGDQRPQLPVLRSIAAPVHPWRC